MCWIAVKDEGKKFNIKYVKKAQEWNKDGYGVTWWTEQDGLQTVKTMDFNRFLRIITSLKDAKAILHLRNTTKGTTHIDNNHPFDIKFGVMFHNGTINTLKSDTTGGSDTKALADIINQCSYDYIKDIMPLLQTIVGDKINRLVFIDIDGNIDYVNKHLGMEEDGIWYSNDYHKRSTSRAEAIGNRYTSYQFQTTKSMPIKKQPKTYKIFVYGTLKKGENNHNLLAKSKFLGEAVSLTKWEMVGIGLTFPYVLKENMHTGQYIYGEIYEVDEATKRRVDMLEGVPHHYQEKSIWVSYLDRDSMVEAIIYVRTKQDKTFKNFKRIDNWTSALAKK